VNDQPASVLEIRDPALDGEAIARLVRRQVGERRAEGAYDLAVAELGPPSLRQNQGASPRDAAPGDFPGLSESLAELFAGAHLREPDFTSDTPFVGPLIVAARRLWNWMSTKWYVRPILRQQTDVNARVARIISDLAQWHELDARRLRELEAQVAALEARLARLEGNREP
jgi:hypothetical protein